MSYDAAYGLVVFLFSGPENTDDDFRAYVDAIAMLKAKVEIWQAGPARLPAAMLVLDPGTPLPNARWRKEIAEVSADLRPPMLLAIVNDSSLVRGTVTAMNWLRPPPFETGIFATFADAVGWIEAERGVKLPLLESLLVEARAYGARGERGPVGARKL